SWPACSALLAMADPTRPAPTISMNTGRILGYSSPAHGRCASLAPASARRGLPPAALGLDDHLLGLPLDRLPVGGRRGQDHPAGCLGHDVARRLTDHAVATATAAEHRPASDQRRLLGRAHD